ncbi:MAG: hypothetical protein M1313_05260 [Nitrospirae bacterium]|nr:hypothetical protein [Nitrospirota bacterium]
MKQVLVRLASLSPGAVIVADVVDPLGRLLVKGPVPLDEHLKNLLLSRGVREVFIEDRRTVDRVESDEAIRRELASLEKRLSRFLSEGPELSLKATIMDVIGQFYREKR